MPRVFIAAAALFFVMTATHAQTPAQHPLPGDRPAANPHSTRSVVMGRRGHAWTEAHAELFLGLYERTAGERARFLRESEQRRVRRGGCPHGCRG